MVRRLAPIVLALAAVGAAIVMQRPRGEAHRLEKELGLGERPALPRPGEPATAGGGIESEVGGPA